MTDAFELDPGFYWVHLGANPPEIASWLDGAWWLCGNEKPWGEEAVEVLSKRLVMPPKLTLVP